LCSPDARTRNEQEEKKGDEKWQNKQAVPPETSVTGKFQFEEWQVFRIPQKSGGKVCGLKPERRMVYTQQ